MSRPPQAGELEHLSIGGIDMPDISIGATTLRYRQAGTGDPALLLVHGTGAALWGELPARLAEQHRTIDYDRRGFGGSSGPRPTSLTDHTADAVALLDRLDVARPIVVGWSIGGVVALDLAVRHPDRVAGLVLVEAPLHAKRHATPRLLAGVLGGMLQGRRDPRAGAARFLRFALRNSAHRRPEDSVPPDWWDGMLANSEAIVHEIGLGTGEHLRAAELAGIHCPTVVLRGDRSDPLFGRAARRIAAAVPGATLQVVTGSGHVMQRDRPDAIVTAVHAARPGVPSPPAEAG